MLNKKICTHSFLLTKFISDAFTKNTDFASKYHNMHYKIYAFSIVNLALVPATHARFPSSASAPLHVSKTEVSVSQIFISNQVF